MQFYVREKTSKKYKKKSLSCAHLYFADLLITDCHVTGSKECKIDKKSLSNYLFLTNKLYIYTLHTKKYKENCVSIHI